MKAEKLFKAIGYIDEPQLKEAYITMHKKRIPLVRITAAVATLAIVISGVLAVKAVDGNVEMIEYSAKEIGELYEVHNTLFMPLGLTNEYTVEKFPSGECFEHFDGKTDKYLPVYKGRKTGTSNQNKLKKYVESYEKAIYRLTGINTKVGYIHSIDGNYFSTDIIIDPSLCGITVTAHTGRYFNSIYFRNQGKGYLNDMPKFPNEYKTDEEITEILKEDIRYLNELFEKDYKDVYIERIYGDGYIQSVVITLYNKADELIDKYEAIPPDYSHPSIMIEYRQENVNDSNFRDELDCTYIRLSEPVVKDGGYTVEGLSETISLDKAEEYLEKGYVFAQPVCPICSKYNIALDFSDYSYVQLEYESLYYDDNKITVIPCYVFYKYISKTSLGYEKYARTCVPAIELEGYEEYFENKLKTHNDSKH